MILPGAVRPSAALRRPPGSRGDDQGPERRSQRRTALRGAVKPPAPRRRLHDGRHALLGRRLSLLPVRALLSGGRKLNPHVGTTCSTYQWGARRVPLPSGRDPAGRRPRVQHLVLLGHRPPAAPGGEGCKASAARPVRSAAGVQRSIRTAQMAHGCCSGSKVTLTGQRIAAAPGPLPDPGCYRRPAARSHCCARTLARRSQPSLTEAGVSGRWCLRPVAAAPRSPCSAAPEQSGSPCATARAADGAVRRRLGVSRLFCSSRTRRFT
jgi:hypothetical protein